MARFGCGSLLRQPRKFLGSSALVIDRVFDPAIVVACPEAISLAQDLHLHDFIISSDSKQVI